MLTAGGFEISTEGEFVLYEEEFFPDRLFVKDKDGERAVIAVDDIIMVESFNHELVFYVGEEQYTLRERLYAIEERLPFERFVRVSQSCIVNRYEIVRIVPAFGSRYDLTLSNGLKTSVARSYFTTFKRRFGL